MKIGLLHSLIRKDEKFLIDEFNAVKGVELIMIDDREVSFNIGKDKFDYDVVKARIEKAEEAGFTDDVATIKRNIKRVCEDNPGMFDDFLKLV